jgi:hypothetical protein
VGCRVADGIRLFCSAAGVAKKLSVPADVQPPRAKITAMMRHIQLLFFKRLFLPLSNPNAIILHRSPDLNNNLAL